MKKIFSIRFVILLLIVCSFNTSVKAQKSEITVALDTNMIIIGDHINLTFRAVVPRDVNVEFPKLKDTIVKGLEILDIGSVETNKLDNNFKEHILKYKLTAFDTGVYKIPTYPVKIKHKGHDNVMRSDVLYLGVNSFKVDTQKGYADIVPPKKTPVNIAEVIPYFIWLIVAAAVILLVIFLIRKWKRKESVFKVIEKPKEPAHIIAFRDLDKMKRDKLWERGNVKEFYTQLTEILRVYIENQFGILAMEQTSIEIIEDLREEVLFDKHLVDIIQDILANADFVKFAKANPLGDENQMALTHAYEIVASSHKAVEEKIKAEESESLGNENV